MYPLGRPSQQFLINFIFFLLKVRTVLENPTRYHVIQKQKTQLKQFLSESFQNSTQWGVDDSGTGTASSQLSSPIQNDKFDFVSIPT